MCQVICNYTKECKRTKCECYGKHTEKSSCNDGEGCDNFEDQTCIPVKESKYQPRNGYGNRKRDRAL